MDEVDELLLEQDLLSPTATKKTLKSFQSRGKLTPGKQESASKSKAINKSKKQLVAALK